MQALFSHQRVALAFAAFAVGLVVFWLSRTPLSLLAPMAALFMFARGRAVLALYVASSIGLAGALLVAAIYVGAIRDLAAAWAALFAVAPCIGAIVTTSVSASSDAEATRAAIPNTTRDETPSYPVIGPTLQEKAVPRNAPFVSISAEDDEATTAQLATVSFWGGTPFYVRYWRRQRDGRHCWVESRSEPLREPSGTRLWSSLTADVPVDQAPDQEPPTKIASNPPSDDDAVRAAKIVENLLGNAWAFDATGRPTYLTPFAQTFVAVTLEEFQAAVDEGHTIFKRTAHPDDYDRISAAWRHSLRTGDPFFLDRRIRRASGIYEWNRTGIVPTRDKLGRIIGWYGSTIDLDSHRIAEAVLRDRERELSQLVSMVPSHLWRLTPEGEPVFFNKRMVDFLGFDIADTDKPGRSRLDAVLEAVHPSDAAAFRGVLNRCLVTGENFALRYRLRRADGVYRWMSSRAEPMRDEDGRILQWYGLCHDVDDQIHADEALRRSERQLQQLIDTVPAVIWCTTPEGIPCYLNKRATDVTGLTLEDLIAPDGSRSLPVVHPDDRKTIDQALAGSLDAGTSFVGRYRQRRAHGPHRWVESRAEPLRDQSGNIIQWYGVTVDIHDLVTAQEALRQSERQLQQLIDTVPAIMWSTTPEGIPCYLNKRATDVIGATLKDLIAPDGSRSLTVIHPDDRDAIDQAMARSFETGAPFVGRYRQRRADGAHRWVESRAEPLRDDSGNIIQWYGVSVDIDDLVTAQEALRDRERELSQLVNMVPVHIRRMTPQGEPTFFNKRLMDFFGLGDVTDLDKPGMSRLAAIIQTLVHPDDAARLLGTARRSFASGEPFSIKYRMRRADGAYRWVDTRGEPLRNQSGAIAQWYVVSLDIDDEMRAQETVRNREAELSQLVDMVPSLLWRLNPDGEPNYFNKRAIDFLGLDAADYDKPPMSRLAATLAAIIHPDDAAAVTERLNHSLVTGETFSMTYRLRRADGVYRWVSGRAEPMRDENGRIVQWYGLAHDIDAQMRAEAAIRQSEQRLQQMIDAVPVYILSFTASGEPIYINKRYQDYLGFSVPTFDSLQEQLRAIIHPDDFVEVHRTLSNCFQMGEPFLMRFRRRGKDGIYRWTEGRVEPLRDQNGAIVQWYGVSLDIEDERRAQEALRQASAKLAQATQAASLAELSASIAHEVNQPLAAIINHSHACQRWLEGDPPNLARAQLIVNRIIRDANSAAEVVSRIRALFRQTVEPRNTTALASIIAEAHNLMTEEATRRRVRIDEEIESDLPLVAFDRVQVQQVLINLIGNGMDAMDASAGDKVLKIRVRRMGDTVQTEISDRGQGIDFPDKIFEPFFTTKEHGMGMGLAICRSIVESHGGRLWAENNRPHGATFTFTLPVEEKVAS